MSLTAIAIKNARPRAKVYKLTVTIGSVIVLGSGPRDDGVSAVSIAGQGAGCDAPCALIAGNIIGRGGVGPASSLPFF